MAEQIILDMKVNTSAALQNIADLTKANNELKASVKAITEEEKKNGTQTDASIKEKALLNAQIKENNAGIRDNTKELKTQAAQVAQSEGSINSMRTKVKELSTVYNSMSKEMRDSDAGKAVAAEMNAMNTSINEASLASGNFKDNIGNYPQLLNGMGGSIGQVSGTLSKFGIVAGQSGGQVMGAFKQMGAGAKAFGMTMLTPPVIVITAVLAAIMLIINELSKAFKKNDDAGTALAKGLASLKPIGELIGKVFTVLAVVIGKYVEMLGSAVAGVMSFMSAIGLLPEGMGEASDAAQDLVVAEDNLQEAQRQTTLAASERNKETAKLRADALDKEKYTAKEREDMLAKAIENEKANLEADKKLKAEKLRILEATAKQENDTSDATKDAIVAARAAMNEAETNYFNGARRLTNEMLAAQNENRADEAKAIKDLEDKHKAALARMTERKNVQAKIEDDLENIRLEIMQAGQDKEIAIEKLAGERRIEELKNRLATETNLTDKAKQDLRLIIEAQEVQNKQNLLAIGQKYADDKAAQDKAIQDKIDADNLAKSEEQKAFDLKNQADTAALKLEQRRLELDNELAFEQEQNDALLALDKEAQIAKFGTVAAYELEVLKSNEKLKASNADVVKKQKEQQLQMVAAIGSIANSMSDLFGSIAGDSKALAGFQKAMGMVDILTNMAVGVSGAIAAGSAAGPFPLNLAAIASGVGSVVAGITSAIGLFSKSEPEVPSRLGDSGGGGGSTPSITVPKITMPTAAINPTLATQAATGSQSQINSADAISAAVANQPSPTVLVSEINQGLSNVQVKENKSKF